MYLATYYILKQKKYLKNRNQYFDTFISIPDTIKQKILQLHFIHNANSDLIIESMKKLVKSPSNSQDLKLIEMGFNTLIIL
ncbi:hypothetical protein BpHYR1_017723 [Brachionus plicatilis]|uniref:Uncharacterized protein n=1 Tax=Brachionus plicatilis TaxID=10195 RepID=A0A3M7T193_BRAPC|nr:hypothetical protein BpHYR1_017723 [Brachionus plicatilis]